MNANGIEVIWLFRLDAAGIGSGLPCTLRGVFKREVNGKIAWSRNGMGRRVFLRAPVHLPDIMQGILPALCTRGRSGFSIQEITEWSLGAEAADEGSGRNCLWRGADGAGPIDRWCAGRQKQILRLEEVQAKAWLKHDWATISTLVADDFQYWSFKGTRRIKDDLKRTLEQSREGETKIEDPQVQVYGDAAVFTARVLDTEKQPNGPAHVEKTCVTDVFIRRAGTWRLVASQETLLSEDQ